MDTLLTSELGATRYLWTATSVAPSNKPSHLMATQPRQYPTRQPDGSTGKPHHKGGDRIISTRLFRGRSSHSRAYCVENTRPLTVAASSRHNKRPQRHPGCRSQERPASQGSEAQNRSIWCLSFRLAGNELLRQALDRKGAIGRVLLADLSYFFVVWVVPPSED